MKRIITLLMAVVLIVAIAIPTASAAVNTNLDTTQKVSFSVDCTKAGYEFSVYKIAELTQTSASPYAVRYYVSVASDAVKNAVKDGNISESERAKILNELDKDTALTGAAIVGTYKVDSDGPTKTFSNLAQGIYYVRATNFPAGVKKVANSCFALPYYTSSNGWTYTLDGSINLAAKVWEDNPHIVKEITNSTRNSKNMSDVSLGDTVEFKITTDTVGAVNAVDVLDFKLKSYEIKDKMSKGLTLNRNSFAVALADADGTILSTLASADYTVSVTAREGADTNFTISLTETFLKKTAFYDADYVVTTYSAVLNKYAVTGTPGNPNDAIELSYTNKNDVKGTVEGNEVYVYTFEIQVHKFDDAGQTLQGAEFALYKTEANARDNANAIATGTSDTNGFVKFYTANNEIIRLESGTYYAKETKAPTGYNRYSDVIPVQIAVTYNTTLTNGTYIQNAPENGIAFFEVKNSKSVLPQTGGAGNYVVYAAAGALAIAGAVVFFIVRKKKKDNN